MKRIDIEFIPAASMRVPGVGDWFHVGETLYIRAIEGPDAFLIALHELVEAVLCEKHGVSQADVDAFDDKFAGENHPQDDEPGDDPRAPYRTEHRDACIIEFLMARLLGISDYGLMR